MATEVKKTSIASMISGGTEWIIVGVAFAMSLITCFLYTSVSEGDTYIGKEMSHISYLPNHWLGITLVIMMLVGAVVKCAVSINNGENWAVETMACLSIITAIFIGGYLARATDLSMWWFIIPAVLIGLIYTPLMDAQTGQKIFFVVIGISILLGVGFSVGAVVAGITVIGIKLWLTMYFVVVAVAWITAAVVKN